MICNESKQTISVSGGLRLLQMVSESVTEWCANENVGPHISWRGEQNIPLKVRTEHTL